MGLLRNYGNAFYEWLSNFATTFRQPIANDDVPSEYISYSADLGNFNQDFTQAITIYSHSTSYSRIMNIVDEIESAVGENGTKIEKEWGYITIYKGDPFYQDQPLDDDEFRAGYINFTIRIFNKEI